MPFVSEAQRRYLYAKHPRVAQKFEQHTQGKLPQYVPASTHEPKGMLKRGMQGYAR